MYITYNSTMNEVFYLLAGIIAGTVGTLISVALGGKLVHSTYLELTQPYIEDQEEEDTKPQVEEGYNWDEYDSYVKNGSNPDDEIIEN